ncbi:hypothetical protein GCM10007908_14370 [Rhizobium albus]|nr:hypothetical protein GCM10007908_14370 [Rhizobium albus]
MSDAVSQEEIVRPSIGYRAIIAGHSHVNAMVGWRHELAPTLRIVDGTSHLEALDGPWPRLEEYWKALVQHADNARIAIVWGGNEHNARYFFRDAYDFDFSSKHVTKILNNIQIIARSTIRKRFYEGGLSDLADLLDQLKAARPQRLVIVGTPPPKKDNDRLRTMFEAEPHFLAYAEAKKIDPADIRITEPHIRLKLWYLLQDILADEAKRIGGIFLPVLKETQDEDGYLRDEFWASDVTHANPAYGRLMLDYVVEELEKP